MTSIGDWESPDDSLVVIGDVPQPKDEPELEDLESTSIGSSYCAEWDRLFSRDNYLSILRSYGMKGKLRSCRFRSVCWKLYLEVLSEDQKQWLKQTRQSREKYEELKNRLVVNPRKEDADLSVNNPLSQEVESPWNQFFQDNELRVTIKQDVIRTFPEILFFQDKNLRETMTDILFIYSKEHSQLSYKQGMHELLAPLIFILHCDHQAFLHASEIESLGSTITELLDPAFVEHDAYAMFHQIMATVEPWYVSKELSPTVKMKNILKAQPFARNQDLHPSNVIVTKLTRIQDYLLKKHDPELHSHMEKMDIPPQIYGIRWVRLLFGREFPMQDLLMLWDAIFADSISFDLVDFIFVGMLLYIRDAMLTSDYPSCLHLLMKYPPVGDVNYFVEKALYLREPNSHARPHNYVYQKPANFGYSWENGTSQRHSAARARQQRATGPQMTAVAEKAATVVSGISTLTRRLSKGRRPQHLNTAPLKATQRMSKSTSEPMNLLTDQSPEEQTSYAPRKGSTASLSQLEHTFTSAQLPLRGAGSMQSLPHSETSSVRGVGGGAGGAAMTRSYPGSSTVEMEECPGGLGRNGSTRNGRSGSNHTDVPHLLGKLNEMELLCRRCAEKMGGHIDKLQREVLSQNLNNEDELLVALAGLKQVRDVLKGTLKPNNVFNLEEISIHDNYYNDDLMPGGPSRQESCQSSEVLTPLSTTPTSEVQEPLDELTAHVATPSDSETSPPKELVEDRSGQNRPQAMPRETSKTWNRRRGQKNTTQLERTEVTMPKEVELSHFGESAGIPSDSEAPDEHWSQLNSSVHANGEIASEENTSHEVKQHVLDDKISSPQAEHKSSNRAQEIIPQGNTFESPSTYSQPQNNFSTWHSPGSHGNGYRSEQDEEWFRRFHSAPATPHEVPRQVHTRPSKGPPTTATNVPTSDDFSPMSSPGQVTRPHARPQVGLSRQHSGGNLYDPNQNTKPAMSLSGGFSWGGRSKTATNSKDPTPMNKITDLFKGAFKF